MCSTVNAFILLPSIFPNALCKAVPASGNKVPFAELTGDGEVSLNVAELDVLKIPEFLLLSKWGEKSFLNHIHTQCY